MFKEAVIEMTEKYVPTKTCKRHERLPFISKEIERKIKKRDRIYNTLSRAVKEFNTSTELFVSLETKFKALKSEIQKMMRIAYWDHVEKIISPMNESGENWTGMKKFSQFIKSMRTDYMGVPALKDKGMTVIDARAKADLLNKQFESVFTKEEDLDATMLFPHDSTYQKMTDIDITQQGIQKMLENLNPHKATEPDDICPMFLKTLASSIAPILMIVYKKSYNTGKLPDDWKSANVVPVFKKGITSLAANYRPISLTFVSSKIMEHIITSSVMRHASTHNILYHLQHGFRDFAKAFDKVGHRRLIEKMKYYGVGGKTNKWIKDFLAGRSQRVVLDGEKSYNSDVLSGVPQDSVLGLAYFYSTSITCLKDSTKKQQSGCLLMIQLRTWQSPTIRMRKSYKKISTNLKNGSKLGK